jgi:hypothetical protein
VKTVQLVVNEYIGSETLSAYSSLTAMYVPFGSTGTDAAGAGLSRDGGSVAPGKE